MVAIAFPGFASRGVTPRRAISPQVRRRRCQVAAVVALGVVVSAAWALWGVVGWLGSGPLATPGPVPSSVVRVVAVVHVVQPGESIWGIARSWQPHGEIRPLVDRLAAETGPRPLQAGDRIILP